MDLLYLQKVQENGILSEVGESGHNGHSLLYIRVGFIVGLGITNVHIYSALQLTPKTMQYQIIDETGYVYGQFPTRLCAQLALKGFQQLMTNFKIIVVESGEME